jgi:hypothetical protein
MWPILLEYYSKLEWPGYNSFMDLKGIEIDKNFLEKLTNDFCITLYQIIL